jgi:SRSO17 transposase
MYADALEEYLEQFRGAFRRRDQVRWAAVYCRGLLLDGPRKNVEALAREVPLPPGLAVESVTQALHNFLNQSPWDEQQLLRRYRALMARKLGHADGVFVLEEVAIPKQGEHSVGVQRQYSTARGEKLNCQVAVAAYYVGAAGYCPLGLQLYLPARWLTSPERLEAAGVPPEFRRRLSKAQLALKLLDEARTAGFPGRFVVAGRAAGAAHELAEALDERQLDYVLEAGPQAVLGTPLVRVEAADGREEWVLAKLPEGVDRGLAARLWRCRSWARQGRQHLSRLGVDHFEGRSWRGFHHHACLVTVACGFLLRQRLGVSGGDCHI